MVGLAVTRITTRLPFEAIKKLLRENCREPFTIMLASGEQGAGDELVLNLIFADGSDLTRVQAALGDGARWGAH